MKKADFLSYVLARIVSVDEARASFEAQLANVAAKSDEATALELEISHCKSRAAFLETLNNDDCASIAQAIKLTREQFDEVERDAKSLDKVSELFSAIKANRKCSMTRDDALAQAVAYLVATDFSDVSPETLRKSIKSKRSNYSEAHETCRQSDMILKVFERLNACKLADVREKNINRARVFDKDNEIVKRVNAIYA